MKTDSSKILVLEDLVKYYGSGESLVRAVDHTSLEIERGKFTAIVGRSGSGKSTLLHLIGGLDRPDEGKVWIEGKDVFSLKDDRLAEFRRKKIGFIFQDFNLIPSLNVWENIVLPLGLDNRKPKKQDIKEVISRIGLTDKEETMPNALSGGQKQRVSIAGVIAMHPKCIILDEPTAMLDPNGRKEVVRAVRALNDVEGITVLLITHYMEENIHADKVFVMDKGRIAMQGTPREIFSRVEHLKHLRLDVPQVTLLAHELKKSGVGLPDGILTVEELTQELMRLYHV